MERDAQIKPYADVVWPVEPLGHRDGRAVRNKLELLDAAHVKPLNDWVRRLNLERSDSLTSVENVAP
ncbi:hypothetical protein ACTXI4_07265 [Glutamicibacter ardleyensis]|uniref:hypothetical protein n=1 Tax=Glutamicibacter ardleyensis TaxID=225894 RepID=UPI003FD1739F